jgi:hypothetical protein
MDKVLIYGISWVIYTLVLISAVYNFATNKEHTACIARQVGYIKQQNDIVKEVADNQAKHATTANKAITSAVTERTRHKKEYEYVTGTESCANVCADILKKGLK